jgi:hypothetical protein
MILRDGRWAKFGQQVSQFPVGPVAVSDEFGRLLCRDIQKACPGFGPVLTLGDQVGKNFRRGETFSEMLLERLETGCVNVQPGHVGNDEWAEEGQPETEGRADDVVNCLRAGDSLFHDRGGFLEKDVLQAVKNEACEIFYPGGNLSGTADQIFDRRKDGFVRSGMRYQFDAGDKRRRI